MTEQGLTRDGFLGGRLTILQPERGFRAGVDAVLLAAAVPAMPGDSVLELGTGVGTAALCLGARVRGIALTGLERQADYAALARRNAGENAIDLTVFEGDLRDMPPALRAQSFDHVIANPPYWKSRARTASPDRGRETALSEVATLAAWCDAGLRRLKPGGRLTMIQAAERLPDILSALQGRAGGTTVHPLAPRAGRAASRVIVTAAKGSRAPFTLEAPVILHEGDRHEADGERYAAAITAVLRDGAAMPWLRR